MVRLLLRACPLVLCVLLCNSLFATASASRNAKHAASKKQAEDIARRIEADYSRLESLYKQLHAQPELSGQEAQTAERLARELREIGFTVTERVGGYGVVGILKNGSGPTVMLRTDMDALPLTEQTGLPYASKVRAKGQDDRETGVMHACGHDIHMACWVGAARALASLKERWKGTLLLVAQPAEETARGAKAMLADGLFTRFPKPDFALALHTASIPCGLVAFREGPLMAGVDSVDILVRGRGGHGAAPHNTVDPIVLAARIVIDLQTLVSRETDPTHPAVVTVGSIHGGTKRNIIPDEVTLQLTVRAHDAQVRQNLRAGIERIAKAAALGANAPEPKIDFSPEEHTPVMVNDPALTRRIAAAFRQFGRPESIVAMPLAMGGEDFAFYAQAGVPSFYFFIGTIAPERWQEAQQSGRPIPSSHSPTFAPHPRRTLASGVFYLSLAALSLLQAPAP